MACKRNILPFLAASLLIACTPSSGPSLPTSVPQQTSPALTESPNTALLPTATLSPQPTVPPTPTPSNTPYIRGSFQFKAQFGPELSGLEIRLFESSQGNMVIAADSGFTIVSDEKTISYVYTEDEIPVGVDAFERLWLFSGDAGEVIYYRDDSGTDTAANKGWQPVVDPDLLRNSGLVADGMSQIWLGTPSDVRVYNPETGWKIHSFADMAMAPPDPDELFASHPNLYYDENTGYIWVTTCINFGPGPQGGSGAQWFDGVGWHGSGTPADSGCVSSFHEDGEGNIWLGIEDGLWKYSPGTNSWTDYEFPPPNENALRFFAEQIFTGPAGELWVSFLNCGGASCSGNTLYRYRNGIWQQEKEIAFFPERLISDQEGKSWLFSFDTGIFRMEDGQWELVADISSIAAALDSQGRLWVVEMVAKDQKNLWVKEP